MYRDDIDLFYCDSFISIRHQKAGFIK